MLKLKKVSIWKAILFSAIALVAALVIGYFVHAGNVAFPKNQETTAEICSNEEIVSKYTLQASE